jgi:cytochrome c5
MSIKTNSYIDSGLFLIALLVLCLARSADVADGAAVYKATCATCHDSGAGQAPRITHRNEWASRAQRGRAAMHEAAIKGVPNSAMAAKGGYTQLSDNDVKAAVDYILARTGYQDNTAAKPAPVAGSVAAVSSVTTPQTSNAPVADPVLLRQIAEALRREFSPAATIENVGGKLLVRGVNIRVGVRNSVVTLEGTPEKPDVVGKAEQIAKSFRSVERVDNRLVAAGMLDFD